MVVTFFSRLTTPKRPVNAYGPTKRLRQSSANYKGSRLLKGTDVVVNMRYLICMVTNDDNLCRLVLNVVKVLLGQHGVVCVGRSEVDLEAWAAHQDSRSSLGSPRSSSLPHHEIRESAEAHESPVRRTHLDNLFFAKPRALSGAVACGR